MVAAVQLLGTSLREIYQCMWAISGFASVIHSSGMHAHDQAKRINNNFLSEIYMYWIKCFIIYVFSVSLLRYFMNVVLFIPCEPWGIFIIRGFGHLGRSQLVSSWADCRHNFFWPPNSMLSRHSQTHFHSILSYQITSGFQSRKICPLPMTELPLGLILEWYLGQNYNN